MIEAAVGLLGVFLGGFLAIAKDFWVIRNSNKEEGSYAAIRLVCLLENFADKCVDVVYDDGTVYGAPASFSQIGEEEYVPQVDLPEAPCYPDDINWKSLPDDLMFRSLTLPNQIANTNRQIDVATEHAWPPEYKEVFEARQRGYAHLGITALDLARELRQAYSIAVTGYSELNSDWKPREFLSERYEKLQAENQRKQGEMDKDNGQ